MMHKMIHSKKKYKNYYKKTQDLLDRLEMLNKMLDCPMHNNLKHSSNWPNIKREFKQINMKMITSKESFKD